ncbi:hypothetical protein F5888DRAFT_1607718 [Russula emetica]|nr:hypothetical protein F5888DRAFT_1607718 [Russula emetica]
MPFSIKPSTAFYLTLVLGAGQRALAVNDWSVPCTQGKCSWDLPVDSGASGTVHIWGPPSSISDITPATGWQITTSCDPSTTTQDIQLVCKDNNPDCDHLFQGNGAVNTIVRLPDSCGPMPFARVAQHHIHQSNLSSRANEVPVHQLALDTNFTAAGPSPQGGDVHFSVLGTNVKGISNIGTQAPSRRSHRRVWSLSTLRDGGAFNKSISPNPTPIDFSGETNLFHTNIKCPIKAGIPITPSASVSLDVDANVHASIGIGAVAAGTIIPPKITEFGLDFVLDGNVDAKFNVVANISGQVSSGSITLFQVGIPGLSIPGILDLGPEFKLSSRIDATFGLNNIKAVVDVNYDLSGASFVFPPQEGSNSDGITPSAKQVTITTGPLADIGSTFEATAHLIPQIDVGLSALNGIASTSVFLNLDASADFTASTTSVTDPQPCVTASTDINVGVGAQASFFSLFDASVGKSLFDKTFPLFQVRAQGLPHTISFS